MDNKILEEILTNLKQMNTRLSRIEQQQTELNDKLSKIEESTTKMNSHVDFVDEIYEKVKLPFHGLMDMASGSISYIPSKIIEWNEPDEE